ncbi:MAG: efflux RND transporter permease subunit [Xanthomonadales bacterium]|nr:efflux RND transporter permease subunit [Xanthomonadales bacterium]
MIVPFAGADGAMSGLVAYPLEQKLAAIDGIKACLLISRPGVAIFTVSTRSASRGRRRSSGLYNEVFQNQDFVPPGLGGVGQPLIRPMGIDDLPVIGGDLVERCARTIRPRSVEIAHTLETELKQIPGTRNVHTIGAPEHAVIVDLDAPRLAA